MTVPKWPATLPRTAAQEGFSYGFADGRLKTQMDAGPGKMRRRFSAAAKPVEMQLVLDETGLARLEDFWDVDTKGGSLPFWISDIVYQKLLVNPDGTPILPEPEPIRGLPWLAMFATAPKAVPWGGLYWRVSFTLSVMP